MAIPHTFASIQITDNGGRSSHVELNKAQTIIGRGAEADIRLDHPMVSRQHAILFLDADNQLHIKDQKSRNGTIVNGQPTVEKLLAHGDQIVLGPFTLTAFLRSAGVIETGLTRLTIAESAVGHIATFNEVEPPRVQATQLLLLNQLSQTLLTAPEVKDRSSALCRMMTSEHLKGRWAAVVRISALDDKSAPLLIDESRAAGTPKNNHLSHSVIRAIRDKGQAVLAGNVGPASDLMVSVSPDVVRLAIIACPIDISGGSIDLLYVELPPEYGTGEWLALAILATKQYQQAEGAWTARRLAESHAMTQRDLDRARQIQMRLIPRERDFRGLDIAVGFSPCRSVGGDYVDILSTPDGRVLLTVADVCGKGLPAALVSSSIHTLVHTVMRAGMSLCDMMNSLNHYLSDMLSDESFVTMVAVMLDPATGDLEYVNAGHPHPLVITSVEAHRLLDEGDNLPLRIDLAPAELRRGHLAPGEVLALYSDGLTELHVEDGNLLGIAGLAERLKSMHDPRWAARETAAELNAALNELQGGADPEDDRTFLLVKRV